MSPVWILLELKRVEMVVTTAVIRRAKFHSNRHYQHINIKRNPEIGELLGLEHASDQFISLRFNGHFPGGPGLAGTRMSPFWSLSEIRLTELVVTTGAIRRAKLQSKRHHQQTNTQFFYRPDAIPVAQPTVSKH